MGATFQLSCLYLLWQKIKEYKEIFGDKVEAKDSKNQGASELAVVKRYSTQVEGKEKPKKDKKKKKKDKK